MSSWIDQNIMSRIQRNKLVFIETRDSGEISLALSNYFAVSSEMVGGNGIACEVCPYSLQLLSSK